MKRLGLMAVVAGLLTAAAALTRTPAGTATAERLAGFTVAVEPKNPWTSLSPNNNPDHFQFAVVTDRTGGHRAKIFSRAVRQINLLQPEFVMSVGDLIEGYTVNGERMDEEWKEFESYVGKFQMPFFYVPGNHDLTNKEMIAHWQGRYGRSYYHFLYRDVLFLAINSEDGKPNTVSDEQVAYFQKALTENKHVRWTLAFVHKPLWTQDVEANGWKKVEDLLAGRNYTVFCGHVHRYQKFVRNGMNYYQLATTGGGSRLRGVKFGEFDHIAWITMKPEGPMIANVLLDGVYPDDLSEYPSDEKGRTEVPNVALLPVRGRVVFNGQPAAGASVAFYKVGAEPEGKRRVRPTSDGYVEADGSLQVGTIKGFDGIPAGEYAVTVTLFDRPAGEGDQGGRARRTNKLPAKYADPNTTPLKVTVTPDGPLNVTLTLTD
jgi:hypothetical protein